MPHLASPADKASSPKIRVLLVDDNKVFLHVAADFLQRHDDLIAVEATGGHRQALAQAQDLRPQVILVGLSRPGLETIRTLRAMLPEVGIVALTLLDVAVCRQTAKAAGADDLVRKAELITELLPAIRRAMQAGQSR